MATVGVRAEVHFRTMLIWADTTGRVPTLIHDPKLGHVWLVFGERPACAGERGVTAWWACRVDGPLPDDPSRTGRFVMSVSPYEGVDDWWIKALLPLAALRLDAAHALGGEPGDQFGISGLDGLAAVRADDAAWAHRLLAAPLAPRTWLRLPALHTHGSGPAYRQCARAIPGRDVACASSPHEAANTPMAT